MKKLFLFLTSTFLFLFVFLTPCHAQNSSDTNPPSIEVKSPFSGEVVTEEEIEVIFTISDESPLKEVFINGDSIAVSEDGQYSYGLILNPGENLISITAVDLNGNESSTEVAVGFVSFEGLEDLEDILDESIQLLEDILELTEELIKELEDKEIFSISEDFTDLNEELINSFFDLGEELDELIDLTNTVSVEIANAPDILDGLFADFELPEFEEFDFVKEIENIFEIPKGFSFATDISFEDSVEPITVTEEDLEDKNTAVLIDANNKKFVVGFAFLKEVENEFNFKKALNKNYRFQTTDGNPLGLTTTITIPADAATGDAKVSILNKNESIATILLKIAPPKEVKVGKKLIGKPKIKEPVIANIKKRGKKLSLKIKGKNFIQKIATIDGKLERLIGKANFTNVTFVPPEGIKIKDIKIKKKSIHVTAEITDDIKQGVKLFNVITPKGADIGGIVFPDSIIDGKLETSAIPEELILKNN